jgi:hypothetical protein
MLLHFLLQIGLHSAHGSNGAQGHNFLVVLKDVDRVLANQSPVIWALAPGSASLQFPLLDNGLSGDRAADDGHFTGMVNELPSKEVQLSLQSASGEIWRDPDFSLPVDLLYPALRLKLEKGVVSGGLVSDVPSEDDSLSRGVGRKQQSTWIFSKMLKILSVLVGGSVLSVLVGGSVVLFGIIFGLSEDRRWRKNRAFRAERGQEWPLGQDLPLLRDGLQIWVFRSNPQELRTRILLGAQDIGGLFWLPQNDSEGLSPGVVKVWEGDSPAGVGEVMAWRNAGFDPAQAGPLFIEGLDGLQTGALTWEEWLLDCGEMAQGPVVILMPQGESLPKGAVDLPRL